MIQVFLKDWFRRNNFYRLDRESNQCSSVEVPDVPVHGIGTFVGGDFTAIFSLNHKIFFRIGAYEWNIDLVGFKFNYFRIVTLEYLSIKSPKKRPFRKVIHDHRIRDLFADPTYDKIDLDNMFFLSWIKGRLGDTLWLDQFRTGTLGADDFADQY